LRWLFLFERRINILIYELNVLNVLIFELFVD